MLYSGSHPKSQLKHKGKLEISVNLDIVTNVDAVLFHQANAGLIHDNTKKIGNCE